ncbi:MAG: hypothetical protein AAGA56_15415, partial [Myxococcota bacterium]
MALSCKTPLEMEALEGDDDWTRFEVTPAMGRRGFAAWEEAITQTHLAWTLKPAPRCNGWVERHRLGRSHLVACGGNAIAGERGPRQLASARQAYFGVLWLRGGRERVADGGDSATLAPGQVVLWDSERPLRFEVEADFEKT